MMIGRGWAGGARRLAVVGLFVVVVGGTRVAAAPMLLENEQDMSEVSSFTLNFGPDAPLASANIAFTEFDLEVDPVSGEARFTRYTQDVEPLLLPDGQGGAVSTGDMTIEIIDSQPGTFNRRTGVFVTQETYAVYFTGDLSAFGIESPFVLPGSSTGTVQFNSLAEGGTVMEWTGQGALLDGLIPFEYTCTVNGAFRVSNPVAYVIDSDPPFGAIDARIPSPQGNRNLEYGWDALAVQLNGIPLSILSPDDFSVSTTTGGDLAVTEVNNVDGSTYELTFDRAVAPGSWTIVTHEPSGTTACLGFLPGDVDGSGTTTARDLIALIDSLNGVEGRVRAEYSTDINRSGAANGMDITSLVDLLNGAGTFDRWYRASIGASPCR